jgi:hypothetical protein
MSDIDPELEARWRAASREEPPSALDDAIRAAARREVRAKPGVFRAAPRWVPLAAAATVAAIAVGIVQMTPEEQVTPAIPPPLVAALQRNNDAAEKQAGNAAQVPLREAPTAAGGASAPASASPSTPAPAPAPAPQAPSDKVRPMFKEQKEIAQAATGESDRDAMSRNRSGTFAAAPEPQVQDKRVLAGRQAAPERATEAQERAQDSPEREQALKQKTERAAASSALRAPSPAQSPTASVAARNELRAESRPESWSESQPFPAAPKPTEARTATAPPAAPPPVAAPSPAPMASPPRVASPQPMASPAPMAGPAPAVAPSKLAAESSPMGRLSGSTDAKDTANAAPAQAQMAGALAKKADAGAVDAPERRKDLAPLAPDEWVKRIRRLIAEGRNDDAVKELAAFRREYKERSDALLPSDLRNFKP